MTDHDTQAVTAFTFDAIPSGRAFYRVDRFHDTVLAKDYGVPAYHTTADCGWPTCDDLETVVRGQAVEVVEAQRYDACGGQSADLCVDADVDHARPVRICPRCAPVLTAALAEHAQLADIADDIARLAA